MTPAQRTAVACVTIASYVVMWVCALMEARR
jgi:hypothetical protein